MTAGWPEPGSLKHRVTIEAVDTDALDGAGGLVGTWTGVATVWAVLFRDGGGRGPAAGGLETSSDLRLIMRYRDDIRPGQRARIGERRFAIEQVTDMNEAGRYLVLGLREGGAR